MSTTRQQVVHPLAELREHAHRAATTYQLVLIAGYAQTPNHAYAEARRFGWGKRACSSVKALARIYSEHGEECFRETVREQAPALFEAICLCECHRRFRDEDAHCDCCDVYSTSCLCHCHLCADCDVESEWCGGSQECSCECHDLDCCDDCEGCCWCQCHACTECRNRDGSSRCDADCECECHEACGDCEVRHEDDEADSSGACECACHECASCYDCSSDCECECHECCEDCEESGCSCECHECYECDGCDDDCSCTCHDCCEDCESDDDDDEGDDEEWSVPGSVPADRLERVAERIRAAVGGDFAVAKTEHIGGAQLQAAAYPDGRIEVTREIADTFTDDELAFVLAHEYAHLEGSHGLKRIASQAAKRAVLRGAMRAEDAHLRDEGAGLLRRGVTQVLGGLAGSTVILATDRAESRHQEMQADRRAMEILHESGYDPAAAPEALRKLHGGQLPEPGVVERLLSTHPAPRDRVRDVDE